MQMKYVLLIFSCWDKVIVLYLDNADKMCADDNMSKVLTGQGNYF